MGQRLVDDSTVDTRHEIAARLSVFAPPRVCVFRRSRRMNRENPPRCAESSRARASRRDATGGRRSVKRRERARARRERGTRERTAVSGPCPCADRA